MSYVNDLLIINGNRCKSKSLNPICNQKESWLTCYQAFQESGQYHNVDLLLGYSTDVMEIIIWKTVIMVFVWLYGQCIIHVVYMANASG